MWSYLCRPEIHGLAQARQFPRARSPFHTLHRLQLKSGSLSDKPSLHLQLIYIPPFCLFSFHCSRHINMCQVYSRAFLSLIPQLSYVPQLIKSIALAEAGERRSLFIGTSSWRFPPLCGFLCVDAERQRQS